MLITFRSKVSSNITMFGEVALRLIKLMGHSGEIPGALAPEDIPAALAQLEAKIDKIEIEDDPVSFRHRAFPLIEMLKEALKEDCHVLWSKN